MKKISLFLLLSLLAACQEKEDPVVAYGKSKVDSQSPASKSLSSGEYYSKRSRSTIIVHTGDQITIDQKGLTGEIMGTKLTPMTDKEALDYLPDHLKHEIQPGLYYRVGEALCPPMLVKYHSGDDIYLATCLTPPSSNRYVKQ